MIDGRIQKLYIFVAHEEHVFSTFHHNRLRIFYIDSLNAHIAASALRNAANDVNMEIYHFLKNAAHNFQSCKALLVLSARCAQS